MDSSAAVRLDMNENPLGPSPKAVEAVKKEAETLSRYKDPRGESLKQALADYYNIAADRFVLSGDSGSFGLLFFLIQHFAAGKEDEIIFSKEGFLSFAFNIQKFQDQYNIKTIPAKEWRHDLEAIALAITTESKLIFIVNPENPTGTWISHDELNSFMRKIPKSVKVVVDEAYYEYARYTFKGKYPDSFELQKKYPNLIIVRTFSKAYGLAGLRVGYAIARPELAQGMNAAQKVFHISNTALVGALAALGDKEHLRIGLENNLSGLERLQKAFSQMRIDYIPSKAANFVTLHPGEKSSLVLAKLRAKSIAVNPLESYNMPLWLRVSVGLPEENSFFIKTFAEIMKTI